jgi:hypothetical protein
MQVQLNDLLDIRRQNGVQETANGLARQAGPVVSSNASTRPTRASGHDALGASRPNVHGVDGLQRSSRPRGEESGRRGRSSSPEVLQHRLTNEGRVPEPEQYAGQALEDRQHLPAAASAAAAAAAAATLRDVAGSSSPSKRRQTYIDLTDESSLEPRALKPIGCSSACSSLVHMTLLHVPSSLVQLLQFSTSLLLLCNCCNNHVAPDRKETRVTTQHYASGVCRRAGLWAAPWSWSGFQRRHPAVSNNVGVDVDCLDTRR